MTAEIICVGNELLYGDTLNTNTQYLSKQLAMIGIEVRYQGVVGDYEKDLLEAIDTAASRADIILFSGGLGPTYDDMTKETVAKALGQKLVLDQASLDHMKAMYAKLGREMKANNTKQAFKPEHGFCLPNPHGTAPGIYVMAKNHHFFLMPGPPRELKPMFLEQVKPKLLAMSDQVITSKLLCLAGIGESDLATKISHIMDHSENPRIAPYVQLGTVNIRLTATTKTKVEGEAMIEKTMDALMPYIEPYVYSFEGEKPEAVVVRLLREQKKTLALAESCTGGLMSGRIVNVPGASEVYGNGFVTYSNEAKSKWLQVDEGLIRDHGAVSEAVAIAMASGVAKVSNANYGVGITGIAGPGGGTKEKPVGTVCIAVSGDGNTEVHRYQFTGNRDRVRALSAQYGLIQLARHLNQN